MYRRPKFLEILLEIRREMALEADYDVDLFVEIARSSTAPVNGKALSEFQAEAESAEIDADIPAIPKRGHEVRKG